MSSAAKEQKRLNKEQKIAVDTVEGPVMVVAGPGTGKTQVLAVRVATILEKTHASPWNILCLTFSKSGATAMRDRLCSLIGPDAYRVRVDTIHGFCNDIIVQHPSVFEDWSSLHQISDVERYREMNKIIDSLLPDLALVNPKSPHDRTKDILARIKQLKLEGVTDRKRLLAVADEYESVMAGKSKEGTKAHGQNLLRARKFREFLTVFFLYQEMLQRTSRYDYEDMILNVIAALEREDWLLASLQERYQYVLVDEFQDTNGAQYKFIELLTTDPTVDDEPNLFVVGDDDQAIYRFQGANLANILSFRERFPKAPVIALTKSYRCTQPILDAAENLIENNTERLVGKIEGLVKHLKAATKEKGVPPRLLFAASDMSEPWMIADLVQERLEQGISEEEIAVIVQTNVELLPLHDVFRARRIPVQLSGKLDLLTHEQVGQVLAILKAIHKPGDSALLASAMACACFGCHPADLGALYVTRRERGCSLQELLTQIDGDADFQFCSREAMVHARDVLFDLHNKAAQRTVLQTLEHLYRESGILLSYERGAMDVVDFAALQEFFDRIRQRAGEDLHFTFETFLSDLEYYGNPDYSDVRLSYDLPHLTRTGVQLMTAHKSKGLEFHTVILSNFREGRWDKQRPPPSLTIPEDLLFGWEKQQKSYEHLQDERRVAYVAMTRAKRELIFTCPRELTTGDSMKSVSPSGFFAEAGTLPEEDREVKDIGAMSTLLVTPERSFDSEFEAFLRKRLESFALSPTALNTFLDDPKEFLEVHLLERPQAKQPTFAYGNAVHHALARWALQVQEGKPLSPSAFLAEFTAHLAKKELLTDAERARLEHIGKIALPRYVEKQLQPPYPIVHKVEFPIKAHLGDPSDPGRAGISIKGKIDRIDLLEPDSSFAVVRDYKTGKPKTEKECRDYGYQRQLVFYALLIEQGYSLLDPKEFVIDFVGEGEHEPIERRFAVGSSGKEELKRLIEAVWAKIVALDFSPL